MAENEVFSWEIQRKVMATLDPAALFQSISDSTRLRLLRLLGRHELNVQEMVRTTALSQPRVSKHLAVLREQGWIAQRREGTWSWYRAVKPGLFPGGAALFAQVMQLSDQLPEAEADDGLLAGVLAERRALSRDFFAGIAHRWDEIRHQYEHPDIRLGAVGALVDRNLKVLDIGTGTGAMLPVFGAHVGLTVAVDNSEAMLARAQDLCRREQLQGISLCNADVARLPFASGAFDAVNCSMVLHHVDSPAAAVAEMARVTQPAGKVMVTGFTRHDQDWMREELAHRWLGFEQQEVAGFFAGAGLSMEDFLVRGRRPDRDGGTGRNGASQPAWRWPDVFLATGLKQDEHDSST
jgi:ArsR family transcriptional regulator